MVVPAAAIVALVALAAKASAFPSTEVSCAPFFFQRVKHADGVHASIVRFQCAEAPPADGTCDPTFTERVYYRVVSGYSCLVEYLARPTPLLEEPNCSARDSYDNYFKRLGMTANFAGWELQDAKSGVMLQVRPNIPHQLALEPCWDYFKKHGYKYVGGESGHAWEGANTTHRVWYSLIAQDYQYSGCVLSADSRRYQKETPPASEGPGANFKGSTCPGGEEKNGMCTKTQKIGKREIEKIVRH